MGLALNKLECATPGVSCLSGRFRPNSTSAVNNSYNQGSGFTVSRTSAGLFLVTLQVPCAAIIAVTPSLQLATAANQHVQVSGAVSASAGTFSLLVYESGTGAADVASDANNWVHFTVWISNRSF